MSITDQAPPDLEVVLQRLAALEAWRTVQLERAGAEPRANPPITIGPFTNVPAPGSPIRSDWAQQTATVLTNAIKRVGVGLNTSSQAIAAGTNPDITWPTEVYDTDNMHVAGAAGVTINTGGLYVVALNITAASAVSANSLCRLVINGTGIWQNTIVAGQSIASVTYAGPLAATGTVKATFWNAGAAAINIGASMEINRIQTTDY